MNFIDALGKPCPMPVILAKKEMDANAAAFVIAVDNNVAVENLKRLAANQGYQAKVEEDGKNFRITMTSDSAEGASLPEASEENKQPNNWALFVSKDYIGEGGKELGETLMPMFFYTLSESDDIPRYILFMNGGVKLPVENEQVIEHLEAMQKRGTQVLVCGACLKFFHMEDALKTGTVSNMYDIADCMLRADKVITL